MGLNVKGVDASNQFISGLKGVTDPELKRKIIGNKFIDVFDAESNKISNATQLRNYLSDVIESISVKDICNYKVTIMLEDFEKMNLKVIEPLRCCLKMK